MAVDEQTLQQVIADAGGTQALLDIVKQEAAKEDIVLSQKALAGAATLTVNDWNQLGLFLQDRAHAKEVQAYQTLCMAVNTAIAARDADALLLYLLLAYRVTRAV